MNADKRYIGAIALIKSQTNYTEKEAKEKLGRFRPASLDQAQRISGITPADIAMVMLHLEGKSRS